MKKITSCVAVVLIASLLVTAGCKQSTTEVESKTGTPEKSETKSSSKNSGQAKEASADAGNLVDVPANQVEYIYKPYASVKLTAEQKAKADLLIKKRGAELRDLRRERSSLLATPELRKKREDAIKGAKASGGDVDAAEKAAVGAEIHAELSRISEKQNEIMGELRKAVKTVLTKEQIKQINEERKSDN